MLQIEYRYWPNYKDFLAQAQQDEAKREEVTKRLASYLSVDQLEQVLRILKMESKP